jgi:NADH-quinone oxidoreductase subunit N
MMGLLDKIHLVMPEMIVLATVCIALLSDLFFHERCRCIAWICSLSGLLFAGVVSFLYIGQFSLTLLHGLFISDDTAYLMKVFICLTVFLSFFYSKSYLEDRQMPAGDYYVLGLLSTLGMMVLVSAHSLLTVYLGLELLSLPLYAMTAIRRSDSNSTEAAMKYFLMGAIASGMLLYGMSLLYGATGQLDLFDLAHSIHDHWQQQRGLLSFSLVFILAGLGFKLAVVPFHMWVPDVYQGAPSSVTLLMGTAPKIAAVGMALRVLTIGLPDIASMWQQLVLIMALLSAIVGNLLALNQNNIKRLLAYSAISHMGYALFGLLAATSNGYAASLYYVLVYAIMSTAAFGLVVILSNSGVEIEAVDDLKGLNRRNPWIAFMMMIVMLSMAGIPPTVGFFTKLLVLKALVDVQMTWVAVLGLIFAVVGAFYYLRIIKVMYFDDAPDQAVVQLAPTTNIIFSFNCLSLLYLGIFPSALITACIHAVV